MTDATMHDTDRAESSAMSKSQTFAARTLRGASLFVFVACFATVASAAGAQKAFASADEAASALASAVKAHDRAAIVAILGAGSDKWITSGDAVADRAAGDSFVASFEQKHAIVDDNAVTLSEPLQQWLEVRQAIGEVV